MVIRVLDHVKHCYSSADGAVIAGILREEFARGHRATLSFEGITDVTSSFVNVALVSFITANSADWLKSRVTIQNVTVSTAELIRRCMANGENNRIH
jgi:hypothetical protein